MTIDVQILLQSNLPPGPQGPQGPQGSFNTSSNAQVNSLGVGTAASGTQGEILATNNITAYYSDERLKERVGSISNALAFIKEIEGFKYRANSTAEKFGYQSKHIEVGFSAQQVKKILPEVIDLAPFDTAYENGEKISKSGEYYLTLHYDRLLPLVVEALKELSREVDTLKLKINKLN